MYTYIDGELCLQQERQLYSHVATCQRCQYELDSARNLHHLLEDTIKYVDPPEGFADRVLANLPSRIGTENVQLNEFQKEQETPTEKQKQITKLFTFKNRWVGVAAGLLLALFSTFGLGQIAQIAIDPKAEEGFYLAIIPKSPDELIADYNDKNNLGNNQGHSDNPVGISEEQPSNEKDKDNTKNDNKPSAIIAEKGSENTKNGTDNTDIQNNKNTNSGQSGNNQKAASREPEHTIADNSGQKEPDEIKEPFTMFNATSTVTVTSLVENVSGASWNSNGSGIIYTLENEGRHQVQEISLNGGSKKSMGYYSAAGRWSPNNEYIVYTLPVDGSGTIWIEGNGEKKNITPVNGNATSKWAYDPIWSSKGEIAFLTDRFGGTEIMVADLDGDCRRVTFTGNSKDAIAWSPDGSKIAYQETKDEKNSRNSTINVISAYGENAKTITSPVKANNMAITWSPDGKLLAVNIAGGEQQGVWLASANGKDWERRLTAKGGGKNILWSPDGQKIAFNDPQGIFHAIIWKSTNDNISMVQITHSGTQMVDAYIEWSKNSRELLIEQTLKGTKNKKAWIASLPKSINAY